MPFGMEKLEWCSYPMVKKFEDIFIHFNIMYECDRHTHRHTPHDSISRACIASRDKNRQSCRLSTLSLFCRASVAVLSTVADFVEHDNIYPS